MRRKRNPDIIMTNTVSNFRAKARNQAGNVLFTGITGITAGYICVAIGVATNNVALTKAGVAAYYTGCGLSVFGGASYIDRMYQESK